MSYKGRYNPVNPKKYKGNPQNIIYRSLWERKFMVYCDTNDKVLEWGSEEIIIPYISPWDGKVHRYFPDFYIKVRQSSGNLKKFIIEVKPKKQTRPPKPVERKTKRWINEVRTFGINEAKWKHATKWCKDNDMEFKILTEEELGIRYK
jgi:TnsA endonuclease N terminal.